MTDIYIQPDDYGVFDAALLSGDLVRDDSLRGAVRVSLQTEREDASLPPAERRGWWGDALNADASDRWGSYLWRLQRAKRTDEALQQAKGYAEDALQWLVSDGIADSVSVAAEWIDQGLGLLITIKRPQGDLLLRLDYLWDASFAPIDFAPALIVAPTPTTYDDVVLADGPVGYYPMQELDGSVMYDRSGNDNHGTYVGGLVLGSSGLIDGGATSVQFVGLASAYATVPRVAINELTANFTAEVWFKRQANSSANLFEFGGHPGSTGGSPAGLALFLPSTSSLNTAYLQPAKSGDYGICNGPSGSAYNAVGLGSVHAVVTVSATGAVKLYSQGTLIGSGSASLDDVGRPWNIGIAYNGGLGGFVYPFAGRMSHFALYAGVLSAERIAAHYAKGIGS